ncbi:BTB/POZ domain-containing protein At1g67900 [Nymphaea colorata]|nr:BTB/POZ domain-containing protein At1g67900 [Nymphaea colorata]XP_031480564.1 BTB/POZ domain-containing protein At1g67900 [Nymphaea colorata]XP_031480565.1 BTB/POZ domain-containing protein At1g67900 [Nymphaea colorata]
MKFMKLGTRPDTFYSAEAVRSVSSEVPSDLIIQINNTAYLLHKFPLLSRCGHLQLLISEANGTDEPIKILDFPGGIDAFELCAKFCYGITITLSAHNIVAVRCAAEYLKMTEEIENGNLIYKLEVFFSSCILKGWKDSIIALQSTKALPQLSEELKITSRCVDSIAYRVLLHPSKLSWSRSCSVRGSRDECQSNGNRTNSRWWWGEDISELCVDHYLRVMLAIKSGNRVPANLIGEALHRYALRWLPILSKKKNVKDSANTENVVSGHKMILESIVTLLPTERNSVSCSFLLKLLKASSIIGASCSTKLELARRVGMQLEEARAEDLLIPSLCYSVETLYDVEIVQRILEEFMMQWNSPPTSPQREKNFRFACERRRSRSTEDVELQLETSRRSSSASHCSKLKVAKIIDCYLQEISRDPNLSVAKVIELAEKIPDFARPDHDDLYWMIDIFLKAHPGLSKSERKQLCRLLDCKKLSMEACVHAAQNEKLPLRVVVQVLFFEQVKAGISGNKVHDLPSDIKALLSSATSTQRTEDQNSKLSNLGGPADDAWSISLQLPKSDKTTASAATTLRMRLAEAENDCEEIRQYSNGVKNSKLRAMWSVPSGPKKMFSKLWSSNTSVSEKERL